MNTLSTQNVTSKVAESISRLKLNNPNKSIPSFDINVKGDSNPQNSEIIASNNNPKQKNLEDTIVRENVLEKSQEKALSENLDMSSKNMKKQPIDVEDVQKYAKYMGENLSIDDINYGLMYGRSVIADYIA